MDPGQLIEYSTWLGSLGLRVMRSSSPHQLCVLCSRSSSCGASCCSRTIRVDVRQHDAGAAFPGWARG